MDNQQRELECVEMIDVAEGWENWWAPLNAVMNLRIP